MFATLIAILATLLFLGLLFTILAISIHNRLVWLHRRCENAVAQLDVHMKRRYELITQLVSQVDGCSGRAQEVLDSLALHCQQAHSAEQLVVAQPPVLHAMSQLIASEAELDNSERELSSLLATLDNPPLDPQFVALQDELRSTHPRILFAREAYNDFAIHYNASRAQFPLRLLASRLGFSQVPLFEIPDRQQDRETP